MKKYRINNKVKKLAKEVYEKNLLQVDNIENDNIYFRTSINCEKCSKFLEGFGEYLSMYNELTVNSVINITEPDLLCFINNKRICHIKYLAYILGKLENKENININKIFNMNNNN